jgi:hypothetical protein
VVLPLLQQRARQLASGQKIQEFALFAVMSSPPLHQDHLRPSMPPVAPALLLHPPCGASLLRKAEHGELTSLRSTAHALSLADNY